MLSTQDWLRAESGLVQGISNRHHLPITLHHLPITTTTVVVFVVLGTARFDGNDQLIGSHCQDGTDLGRRGLHSKTPLLNANVVLSDNGILPDPQARITTNQPVTTTATTSLRVRHPPAAQQQQQRRRHLRLIHRGTVLVKSIGNWPFNWNGWSNNSTVSRVPRPSSLVPRPSS